MLVFVGGVSIYQISKNTFDKLHCHTKDKFYKFVTEIEGQAALYMEKNSIDPL